MQTEAVTVATDRSPSPATGPVRAIAAAGAFSGFCTPWTPVGAQCTSPHGPAACLRPGYQWPCSVRITLPGGDPHPRQGHPGRAITWHWGWSGGVGPSQTGKPPGAWAAGAVRTRLVHGWATQRHDTHQELRDVRRSVGADRRDPSYQNIRQPPDVVRDPESAHCPEWYAAQLSTDKGTGGWGRRRQFKWTGEWREAGGWLELQCADRAKVGTKGWRGHTPVAPSHRCG